MRKKLTSDGAKYYRQMLRERRQHRDEVELLRAERDKIPLLSSELNSMRELVVTLTEKNDVMWEQLNRSRYSVRKT